MWDLLLAWSKKEFNHLPWRKDRSLYGTLVSEIMLQQTTVGTVLQHFERFQQQFPDLNSLASASEEEMLIAWKGLGYYRRAKNLKKIAEKISLDFDARFPDDLETLQTISGIGPYTASALVAIGMDKRALAVDANIERVISRLFMIDGLKGPKLQKKIQQLFLEKKIIAEKHISYRALNEALMDLGRTVCQAKRVSCEICPMKKSCLAHKSGKALLFPQVENVESKKTQEFEIHLLRLVIKRSNKVLVYQKKDNEWLAGQWEIPTFVIKTNDPNLKQYPLWPEKTDLKNLVTVKTGITKYSIVNYVLEMKLSDFQKTVSSDEFSWKEADEDKSNLSTATMKCLKKLKTSF
jgi:A/G-specific adenine glycosylase